MALIEKTYRVRVILGVICLLTGIAFMVHSFLDAKLNPLLKPAAYESTSHFGRSIYEKMNTKLSEKAAIIFAVSDFEHEKQLLLDFLKMGQEMDQREYILVSNETTWTDYLSQNFSFKGVVPTEDSLESDSFVSPTYIVLIKTNEVFGQQVELNLGAESKPEYQIYNFISVPISKEGPSSIKCPNRKRALQLASQADLDCFQVWMEKRVNRKRNLLDLSKTIGAIDQLDLKHFIIYYSK